MTSPDETVWAVIRAAAARLGVPSDDVDILHQHSNAVVALPSGGLVLRIAGSPDAYDRVAGSVRLCRWLAAREYPCTVPADCDPWVQGGRTISVWRLESTVPGPAVTMSEFGTLLRSLHDQPVPPFPVRELADPFASVTLALGRANDSINDSDRNWLDTRMSALRSRWAHIGRHTPHGLIHGDAHPGNTMRLSDGRVIVGDWDHAATGPREWDLIQAIYTSRRFGQPEPAALGNFADAYGRDIRDWPHASVLLAIREITGLSPYIRDAGHDDGKRRELALRVATLRAGNKTAQWHTSGSQANTRPPRPSEPPAPVSR